MNKISNPWLALSTYTEKDELKFKGREKDTENIVTMLQQGDCVVCYAASGDGKSSLINAGVCPAIRRLGMFPVKIIFTTAEYEGIGLPVKENNNKIDFDRFIGDKIKENIELYAQRFVKENNIKDDYNIYFEKETKYKDYEIDHNLWWKLRTETIQVPFGEFDYIPVLIFDQFEEIFSSKWKAEFFCWIENLMRDVCPQSVVNNIKSGVTELPNRKLFKVIFSMRYEYVGELDYWCSQKTFIPPMMHGRYFLKPLSREQAISVICNQSSDDDVSLKMKDCADLIVDNIIASSTAMSGQVDEVSAIVLSLVCFVLFDEWKDNDSFSLTDMGLSQIIYDFYRDKLNTLKVSDEHRRVLEDVLISTQKTRLRIPVSDERLQKINIGNYLDKGQSLVSEHILKQDTSNDENYIELIHDRLSDAIFKHRDEERTDIHNQAVVKNKREGLMLLASLFMLILPVCFAYHIFSTSNDDVVYITEANVVKEDTLVVNDEDYFSKSDSDYYNATSIEFHKNKYTCVSSLYYANNVIYSGQSVFYAHNAKELVFSKHMKGKYQLDLGRNVEEVYVLYPSNISSVKTKNNHTIIYVPYGEYDNCISNSVFDNVCIGRMSIFSTFLYNLMTYSAMDHVNIFCRVGFHFPNIFYIMIMTFVLGYLTERKKLLSRKEWLKLGFLCIFGSSLFYIIIWEMSLFMDFSSKYVGSWTVGMSWLCIVMYYLRPNLKRKLHKTRYCIIYNSTPNKKVAIALKQVLIENGIKEKDIRLDLSIVRHDVFYPDKAETCLLYSKHCITIFNLDSFTDTEINKNYWEMIARSTHFIHPVIIGTNKLEKNNVEKHKRWVTRKNGSKNRFPSIYIPDEKITQQQLQSLIYAINKAYTPDTKIGCLWLITVYIILGGLSIIMILIYG